MAGSAGRRRASWDGSSDRSDPIEALRHEVAQLGDSIERLRAQKAEDGLQRHVRRLALFYALATVWALMLVLFPTSRNRDSGERPVAVGFGSQALADASGPASDVATAPDPTAAIPAVGGSPGQAPRPVPGPAAKQAAQGGAAVAAGSGTTRGGFACTSGARQLPWSAYATQCVPKFAGDNAGATSRGVTKDTIRIAFREFPDTADSRATEAFAAQAGAASEDVAKQVQDTFKEYFGQVFETYGRKVEWVTFDASSQSNSTEELQSRGKEGACIDATKVQQEIKAFADWSRASQPYGECLAERKVVGFRAGAYFPESWYRQHHPYLFNDIMECERISFQVSEYIGKRLAHRKARFAGDPLVKRQTRVFGTYVPNNDQYQHCVDISERELEQRYNQKVASRYNYTLDVSRFPDEAARGTIQFKADSVTTIINADDPISTALMTSAATSQNYFPEWLMIGVATQDVDSVARLYDANQRNKESIFGMSQLGDQSKLWGPSSEPGVTYKRITGKEIPPGTTGEYFSLLMIFNAIQEAGPNLTPETLDRGFHSIVPGGPPDFAVGFFSFRDGPDGKEGALDHTGIDDSREIYWCDTCPSKTDGKAGAYLETHGGKRFRNGEWPAEEPPIYPPGYQSTR